MDAGWTSSRAAHALLLLCLAPFVVLCTMNAATYRYGASDQAFYVPAVLLKLHPDAFPRDAALIHAQAHLTVVDEVIAALSSATGATLPVLFAVLYVASLALLASAAWLVASRLYRTRWAGVALLAALTLRHSISHTGTNTLEGYFHPRQLAFGLGVLMLALMLRRRLAAAAIAIVAAAAIHPTTAMWFGLWLAVGVAVLDQRWRRWLLAAGVAAAVAAVWALTNGPLAGRFGVMDQDWLATLDTKDYLFPLEWRATTWLANLGSIAVIVAIYCWRRAAGLVSDGEAALALGGLSLVVAFAALLPLNASHVALAVQLQPARIFWMIDLLATIYLVWAVAEGPSPGRQRPAYAAAVIVGLSLMRGGYVTFVEFPMRPVAQLNLADSDWGRAMAWARSTDRRSGWLADPYHAVRYGTSLRLSAERDVFVEAVKDTAMGMYDRDVAMRTRDRILAVGDFAALTPQRARELGATYGLDFLVSEQTVDLPLAFQSGPLRIYRLR